MKTILRRLADIILLPVTGCIFPGNRDEVAEMIRPAAPGHRLNPAGPSKPLKYLKLSNHNLPGH